MGRIRVATAVAAVLMLAGCTVPTEESPTAAPTTEQTPTPTADAEDPSDPATWVIDGEGVGPIDIGTQSSELASLLPGFTDATQEACPAVAMFESANGPALWMPTMDDAVAEIAVMGALAGKPSAGSPTTEAGIGVGADRASVEAAYPDVPQSQGTYSPYYAVPEGDRYILIELGPADATVGAIIVSSASEPRAEYCG